MAEILPAHRFVDPGLNYLFTNNYNLSIRIQPDGFSYLVFDTLKNRFISLEEFKRPVSQDLITAFGKGDYIDFLDQIISQCYLLQEKFNKVHILVGGTKYTLMPQPLFDPPHSRKYLAFNHELSNNDAVLHDVLKSPESCLVFSVPAPINAWIINNYPGIRSFHLCSSLIRNFQLQARVGYPLTRMLANIQADVVDIIIFKGQSFQYCNSFHYTADTDLLYYLLFVMEQLKINSEESPLFLAGAVENGSEIMGLLKTYIRHVDLIPESQDLLHSPSLDNAPLHHYYDLLNVSLCG